MGVFLPRALSVLLVVATAACARGPAPRVPREVVSTGVHRFPGTSPDQALSATIATLGGAGYEAKHVDRAAGTLETSPKVLRRWTTKDAAGKPFVHEETMTFHAAVHALPDGAQVALDPHVFVDGVETTRVTDVVPETQLLTTIVALRHELDTTAEDVRAVAVRRLQRERRGVEPPKEDDTPVAGR